MEKEVWDTDNLEPWQIDQLLEMVRRYREKEWKKGDMAEQEREYIAIIDILCTQWENGKMTEKQFRALAGEDE